MADVIQPSAAPSSSPIVPETQVTDETRQKLNDLKKEIEDKLMEKRTANLPPKLTPAEITAFENELQQLSALEDLKGPEGQLLIKAVRDLLTSAAGQPEKPKDASKWGEWAEKFEDWGKKFEKIKEGLQDFGAVLLKMVLSVKFIQETPWLHDILKGAANSDKALLRDLLKTFPLIQETGQKDLLQTIRTNAEKILQARVQKRDIKVNMKMVITDKEVEDFDAASHLKQLIEEGKKDGGEHNQDWIVQKSNDIAAKEEEALQKTIEEREAMPAATPPAAPAAQAAAAPAQPTAPAAPVATPAAAQSPAAPDATPAPAA